MGEKFWKSQPVDRGSSSGIIDTTKNISKISTPLPANLKWKLTGNITEIVDFLADFYVEDSSSSYRLYYSPEFIQFLFHYPHHKPEYSIGLYNDEKIVGYIMGREHNMSLRNREYKIISVNFLCLDRSYRNLGLAPMMIKEMTRIANNNGIFQAIFTAERDYGFSIIKADYFHLPINIEHLQETDLICSNAKLQKFDFIRASTRLAEISDMKDIFEIYNAKSANFMLFERFDFDTFSYNFQNRENVLHTFFNPKASEFATFYIIKTRCITKNIDVRRAYLYYWSGSTQIIIDSILLLEKFGVDMIDIVRIGHNNQLINEIGFMEGTGILKYHLFNIKESIMSSENIDMVLF